MTDLALTVRSQEVDRGLLRGILGAAGTVFSVLVVVAGSLALVLAVATRFAPDGQYTVFGHPSMIVVSGSMSPTIKTGDLIIDRPVSPGQAGKLHVGQIISFRATASRKSIVITHRIHAITSVDGHTAYFTKGDVNNAPDADPVPANSIVGLYFTRVSRGGYLLNALHRPLVLGLLLASPVLWFLSEPLFRWAQEIDATAGREPAGNAGEAEDDRP